MRGFRIEWQTVLGTILFLILAGVIGGTRCVQQQNLNDLQQQIDQVPVGKEKAALVKDRIGLENAINSSLVQAVGGLLLFVTASISFQNLKATQRSVLISDEKQVTERFTQAINQLGSEGKDKITIRLGGIYALERIAKYSEKDHWTIMEVLTSFIQEKSPAKEPEQLEEITKDVQAALVVIGRRELRPKEEPERIDLSKTNLVEANLAKARLNQTVFSGSVLERANLEGANLEGADLQSVNLKEAHLFNAKLKGADLRGANLIGAYLMEADLREAKLDFADLREAKLDRANLTGANLTGADTRGASFIEVQGYPQTDK